MVFEDVGKLSKIIDSIHAAGSGCAMDDFGSGYASLNLIQNIPPPARSFEYAFHQQVQHRHAQQYSPRRQTLLPALLGAGAGHRIQYNPLRGKRLEGPVRFQQVHSLVPDNRSQRHTFYPSQLRQFRIAGYGLRGYSYGSGFSPPADAQWLADYKRGRGSFGEHFRPALNTFQTMLDTGVWKKSDLSLTYAEREAMLFNRQCAMVEDSVLMAQRGGYALTGSTDQFALMPFFSPGTPCDWDRLYMVCYIGLNKHLGEPQNKKKYDPVMQLMDYISTPEGQLALAADTGAMYSSVKKVPAPDIPEIADMLPALSHGRYAIFPEPKNAQNALRESLAGMLAGALTQDDVIRMVDHQNKNPPPPKACTVIGEATADFTLIETGNFLTDAMRAKAGADVALFLDNGKGVSARFRPQTTNDVSGPSPI